MSAAATERFPIETPAASRISLVIIAALVCIGFSAVIAQIELLRELLVVFGGNEISLGLILAVWLLWTAFGGGVLGRLPLPLAPRTVVAALQVAVALVLPATIVAVRATRVVLHVIPGELLGPGSLLLASVLALAAFCTLSGWLFAAGSCLYRQQRGATTAVATGTVYLLEAIGSGIGGLLASIVLIRYCSALQIAFLVGLVNVGCALSLLIRPGRVRRAILALAGIAWIAASFWVVPRLETASLGLSWRGFNLVAWRDSIYGHLDVVQAEAGRSVYENGLVAFHGEDAASAEEAVHFALLQHPAPRSLLLIGGGVNGSLAQALQYASLTHIDYVELDPATISLAQRYFPEQSRSMQSSRVRVHNLDGRLFLKTTFDRYDVIIVNLPQPQTAQLNRFYTREFFEEAAARLNPGGLVSFQLRGAEDYISPELGDFLRCISATLRSVFPNVATIPGETIHFSASARPLHADAQELLSRLRERRIVTRYISENYLPFRMMPDRVQQLERELQPQAGTPINRDLTPAAYYFSMTLWSMHFGGWYRALFVGLAQVTFSKLLLAVVSLLLIIAGVIRWGGRSFRKKSGAAFCVAGMGFAQMALEVLLLLGFQAIYGYVYYQLAIVIAGFMVGMAVGSWLVLRPSKVAGTLTWSLSALQAAAAVSPLLLYVVLRSLGATTSSHGLLLASQVLFPAMAIACGLLGGYQFQIASRVYFSDSASEAASPAALYAIDLVGACLGAIVVSAYLVPVFGMLRTGWLIAAVNLAPALAVLPDAHRKPAP